MRDFDDAEFIGNPDAWPHWPILPVKRYSTVPKGDLPELGVIVAGSCSVLKCSMYSLAGLTIKEAFDKFEKEVYQHVSEIVSAGWMVD